MAKRAVALVALSTWVALGVPAWGQFRSGNPVRDGRLKTWERQLVLAPQISSRLAWAERRLQPSGLRKLEGIGRRLAPAITSGAEFPAFRDQAGLDVLAAFPGLKAGDISDAALIVMAMAAKNADHDLRTVLEEMKAMNAAKQRMREMIEELKDRRDKAKDSLSDEYGKLKAGGAGTSAGATQSSAKTPASPVRRMTLETRISPVIHFEYARTPVIPPLPPRNPGLKASVLESLQSDIQSNLDGMNGISEEISIRLQLAMDRRSKIIQTLSNLMKKLSTTQETLVQNIK